VAHGPLTAPERSKLSARLPGSSTINRYYSCALDISPTCVCSCSPSSSTHPHTLSHLYTGNSHPKCLAIIPILSCAASSLASRSADSATNVMANVPSATRTSGRQLSCASAMSAPSETIKTNASSAVARASATLSTASSALASRKTATDVRRL
jgi:hypothetical protein